MRFKDALGGSSEMYMKRPKILIALFRFPYPVTDGTRYKTLDNVIEGLSSEFDLEFLITPIDSYTQEQITYLEEHYGTVHVFGSSKWSFSLRALRSIFSGLPLQVEGYTNPHTKRWVRKHISNYDAVYVHEVRMTEYFVHLDTDSRAKCLIDYNDAISLNYQEAIGNMPFPKNLLYAAEAHRIKKYESRVLHAFKYFNVITPRDREVLLQNGGAPSGIHFASIPYGVHVPERAVSLSQNHNLFFMGNIDYAPNRDAILYFLTHLWPKVKAVFSDVEFHIIGTGNSLGQYDGVVFHGFVPDRLSIMNKCSLLVAPIRYGAGVPSKIIDTMAAGLPVLTTPIGAAGIGGVIHEKDILIARETDQEVWLSLIARVFQDNGYRKALGEQARTFIIKHYSSDASREAFRVLFRTILASLK